MASAGWLGSDIFVFTATVHRIYPMNTFEKWQALTSLAQAVIAAATLFVLFLTLMAAVYLGFEQAAISRRQTEINETLLELRYSVSLVVQFDDKAHSFNLVNSGETNVYWSGIKIGDSPPEIRTPPRLILPRGGSHTINIDWAEADKLIKELAASRSVVDIPCEFYLIDERNLKYVLHTNLHCMIENNTISIATQTARAERRNW